MKIKDIIAQTDLTDRAIRLYIENGLVSPEFTENYSGRKNIDFTEDDLATLKNIATLRKADFSIAEIKSLTENPENSKTVLEDFLKNKNEKIENNTKIVEALFPLLSTENPDISIICEKLNAVTADKTIPEVDAKVPLIEKIERIFFLSISAVSLLYTIVYTGINLYLYTTKYNVKYPYGHGLAILIAMPTILLLFSLYYFLRYRKKLQKKSKGKIFTRQLTSLLLIVPLGYLAFFMFVITMFPTVFKEPVIYSQTTNVSDYLILDDNIQIPENFFPDEVPEYAKPEKYVKWLPFEKYSSTEYFYRYEKGEGGEAVDIIAQWSDRNFLTKEENIEKAISQMKNIKALDGSSPTVINKGNWTLYYYADTTETELRFGYTYLIFAHDNYRNTIRYIYSTNNIKPIANGVTPYYLTLDWYS